MGEAGHQCKGTHIGEMEGWVAIVFQSTTGANGWLLGI